MLTESDPRWSKLQLETNRRKAAIIKMTTDIWLLVFLMLIYFSSIWFVTSVTGQLIVFAVYHSFVMLTIIRLIQHTRKIVTSDIKLTIIKNQISQ